MEYAIVTTVKVRPEAIDDLAARFDSTNRALVALHDDWLGAWFTADRAAAEVTVIAHWRDPAGYERLRSSDEFQAVMAGFAPAFLEPPVVRINEILVQMPAVL